MTGALSTNQLSLKDAIELYEDGKHRRYSLMFAVNGGAFAIARLLAGSSQTSPGIVLGGLTLPALAIGMAIFTGFMIWDIYVFGEKMRGSYVPTLFSGQGKAVLLILGVLQVLGWLIVAS